MHHILKIFFNSKNDQNYQYIHTSCCQEPNLKLKSLKLL